MKKIFLILLSIFLVLFFAFGQDKGSENNENPKEQKKQAELKSLQKYDSLSKTRYWVLEAHTIYDRYNKSIPVNSSLNFISMKDSLMTIQLSVSNTVPGNNGIGGITIDGKMTKYEINKSKNIFIHCSMLAMSKNMA